MKALVTGGAGFVGSHLVQALAERGHEVVVLDDFSTGSRSNLALLTGNRRVHVLNADLREPNKAVSAVRGCDWVFHLAATPSAPRSVKMPVESNSVNLDATLGLLVAARDAKVSRFIFSSASSIYGNSTVTAQREDTPPNPLSPYALQKSTAERYCQMFSQFYGLPTVVLRYFSVFGPRQSHNSPFSGVVARFCVSFLQGESPVIYGDGSQSRDFTYVEDVLQANLKASEAPPEKVGGQVFNIGGGDSTSLLNLLKALRELSGCDLEPQFQPERPGEVKHSKADISLARSVLGFEPKVDWRTGLERTYAWYRETKAGR